MITALALKPKIAIVRAWCGTGEALSIGDTFTGLGVGTNSIQLMDECFCSRKQIVSRLERGISKAINRRAIVLSVLAFGCATPTASLHATPNEVCAGSTARLDWKGSGRGQLSADRPDLSLGPVSAEGSQSVRPKATTTYRFRVSNLLSVKTSEATVNVISTPDKPVTIGAAISDRTAGCDSQHVWVTARVPPEAWDTHLHVDTVVSGENRQYKVQHLNTTADVTESAPSGAFRNDPIAGEWRLETTLRPDEVCGKPSLPRSLAIVATLRCTE